MTDEAFEPYPAATLLADAWRSGVQLAELPAGMRPATLTQGYDIQDRLVERLGVPTVGWKLGVGSALMKRTSGVGRSVAGRVLRSRVYESSDTIALPNDAPVTIELEIAYVLGRDVLPDEPPFPVMEAVSEVRATFELVLSRFVDRRAVGIPSFAADNGGFEALVVGPTIDPGRVAALAESLIVTVDGQEAVRAATGDDITDPHAALSDLLTTARERGMSLVRGSIISTGSVSAPFPLVAASAEVAAHFLAEKLWFRTCVAGPSAHDVGDSHG